MAAAEPDGKEIALHVCTFLAWTLGVAAWTWFICHRCMAHSQDASDDFFAGGRALRWYIVAGSLMLTNLSTEQLVGLNGAIFADGCLAGVWWEGGAAIAMIVTATVFLPRYMGLGLTTTSSFLGKRYDLTMRTLVSLIFLLYYVVVLCPLVLYTGALAIRNIFDLSMVPLWAVSTLIGLLGAAYALVGGLRAVAVSDCLNGLGLLVAGLWVPAAALRSLDGGLGALFEEPAYLRTLVATSQVFDAETMTRSAGTPSVPWPVTLTGLALTNMYYWSTNQVIVQRALAAESLAHGQKGVLFAAIMKVVGFSFLCLPGIIGILMVKQGVVIDGRAFRVEKADEVYPELVKAVMPSWSLGLFAAVLLGSVLSTFNSALNSAATVFGLEIYKIFINKDASDRRVVTVSTVFGAAMALLSFVVAPQLVHVDSIFGFLQRMNTIVSLPIITVFFVGIAVARPDAFAAKVGFVVAALAGGLGQLIPGLHYLHLYFACFLLGAAAMALATYLPPRLRALLRVPAAEARQEGEDGAAKVDMTPWRFLYRIVLLIVLLLATLVVALQVGNTWLFGAFWCAWVVGIVALMVLPSSLAPSQKNSNHEAAGSDADSRHSHEQAERDPGLPLESAEL